MTIGVKMLWDTTIKNFALVNWQTNKTWAVVFMIGLYRGYTCRSRGGRTSGDGWRLSG